MRFNYNKSYKNLVPKLPPASDRFYANSNIDSSDKNNLSNKDSDPARSANYPTSNIGIRLLSFNSFGDDGDKDKRKGGDIVIAPIDKPQKEQQQNDNTLGIVHNIYTFDITQVFNPDISLDSGFIPQNQNTFFPYIPNGSAYISTFKDFLEYKNTIEITFINQIKTLSPFNEINNEEERLRAAKKWLSNTDYLPKFFVPKEKNLNPNIIKYTYCQYDLFTTELIFCGTAEQHEITYLDKKTVGENYTLVTYPNVIHPNLTCDICRKWIVFCDNQVISLYPYEKNIFDESNYPASKIFFDYEDALKFKTEQENIPENSYKYFLLDDICTKVHPMCYDHPSWEEEFPSEEFPMYDTLEECEANKKYVAVCKDGGQCEECLIVVPESIVDGNILPIINKYDAMENTAYRIFDTDEEASQYILDESNIVFFYGGIEIGCVQAHILCAESLGIIETYETDEECEEANKDSGGVLSSTKAYYFNTNTKQWEYR